MAAKTPWSDLPQRPIALLERVVEGDLAAWQRFISAYAGFLYSLAWRYARGDEDRASELVVVALEGLRRADASGAPFYRLRSYLTSIERFGNRGRFVTWLALVVKNLMRDFFRQRHGRRQLPKEIEGLDAVGQALFKALMWEGASEAEAFQGLRDRFGLTPGEFDGQMKLIFGTLKQKNLYRLYRDLLRRRPAVPLDESGGASLAGGQLPDSAPDFRPDWAYENRQRLDLAARVRLELERAIAKLPPKTRQVVSLLALRALPGEQVRRVMGFRRRQKVYDEMARARRLIRRHMERAGLGREEVLEVIEMLPDEPMLNNIESRSRSGTELRREHLESVENPDQEV
jgi:RNA polymerase sigma factor (sigma-70 family)